MSYQVLARKWRPRNFGEMVGQEHVLKALINALDNDRLHHAFLFTGTRGVGKTTIARILAKSLNCEQGVSSSPCGICSACTEIDQGRFVDLIEVDAASRTKVDDTRDLLENVPYAPTCGRYKVYLIDEVHMLSNHSFNALLKTLEEPPPHVKFLLATTEPKKLPATILSRCLQFNLKRLSTRMIGQQLEKISAAEKVETEGAAIDLLAAAADGSMRDALSLLDQAIPFGGGKLHEIDVRSMLGTIDAGFSGLLLAALADSNAGEIMAAITTIDEQSGNYLGALDEIIDHFHKIAIIQLVPGNDLSTGIHEDLEDLAQKLSPEDVQLYYQIALNGRRDVAGLPDSRVAFEMLMLRMLAFRPVSSNTHGRLSEASTPVSKKHDETDVSPAKDPFETAAQDWDILVAQMKLRGAARELASNCEFLDRKDQTLRLRLAREHEQLLSEATVNRIEESLRSIYPGKWRLKIELGQVQSETPAKAAERERDKKIERAREVLESDPNVKALREAFNAELQSDSVRPVD